MLSILVLVVFLDTTFARDFNDAKPSVQKQQFCEKMIRKYGRRSVGLNAHWYGKGVMRPKPNAWEWSHSKEPGWFRDDLYYVYKQETDDGFKHQGYCHWESNGYLTVYINASDYGGVVMCDSWEDSGTKC